MPPKSKKQARAMFAAAAGKSTKGIPADVGAEFVKGMKKGDMKKLPKRVRKKKKASRRGK